MGDYSKADLEEALHSISSTISKCEKALMKLREETPQHTLTEQRIKAFHIAVDLITRELEGADNV